MSIKHSIFDMSYQNVDTINLSCTSGALQVQYIKPEGYSMAKKQTPLTVETLKHEEATRTNIPTAEHQSVLNEREKTPIRMAYERRNRDLDPQLV